MCICGLDPGVHWYVDPINAPNLWQIGLSPEQAEHNLRSWAGKVVRLGHQHFDMRPIAARVLKLRFLCMVALCDPKCPAEEHPGVFE